MTGEAITTVHHGAEHASTTMPAYFSWLGATGFVILLLAAILVGVLFAWSLYKTLVKVSEDKRRVPAWLCWLTLIPLVNIVIFWILLPFAIPNSIKDYMAGNQEATAQAETLYKVGLANMILVLCGLIPVVGGLATLGSLVAWIIYWVKVVKIRAVMTPTV